jgi:hypothetical protein
MRDALRRRRFRKSVVTYDLGLEFEGKEMYATRNGVRIARRHHRQWLSMVPGIAVMDTFRNGRPTLELTRGYSEVSRLTRYPMICARHSAARCGSIPIGCHRYRSRKSGSGANYMQ